MDSFTKLPESALQRLREIEDEAMQIARTYRAVGHSSDPNARPTLQDTLRWIDAQLKGEPFEPSAQKAGQSAEPAPAGQSEEFNPANVTSRSDFYLGDPTESELQERRVAYIAQFGLSQYEALGKHVERLDLNPSALTASDLPKLTIEEKVALVKKHGSSVISEILQRKPVQEEL